MVRVVVFDFDGTLVRSNGIKRQSFYDIVADIPEADAILDALFSDGCERDRYGVLTELHRRLKPHCPPASAREKGLQLASAYSAVCRRQISSCAETPGATAAIQNLRMRSIATYIVSATPEIDLKPIVSDRALDKFLKGVLGAPIGKIEHLKNIMSIEKVAPKDLAMVGDGGDDFAAAEAIGCQFIGIGQSDNKTLPIGVQTIDDLHPLPGLISHD